MIDIESLSALQNLDFYEKMLGENFYFNNYKVLKGFIKLFCTDNMRLSKKIAIICIKNFTHYYDNILPCLESLKELVLIEDQFSKLRMECILGFPTVLDAKDFWKKPKFGLQVHKDLSMPCIRYRSPLNYYTNSASLLKVMADNFEKKDSTCLIYMVFLLEMMLANDEVFKYVVHLPSPIPLYANYIDLFEAYAKIYMLEKRNSGSSLYGVSKAILYETPFKEKMEAFEVKYLNYIKQIAPDAGKDHCVLIGSINDANTERLAFNDKPIFPLSKVLVVGCVKSEENSQEFTIYEGESDFISIQISQLSVLAAPNLPTGHTNQGLPRCYKYKNAVYTNNIPQGSNLHRFFDIEDDSKDKSSGKDTNCNVI